MTSPKQFADLIRSDGVRWAALKISIRLDNGVLTFGGLSMRPEAVATKR